MGSDFLFPEPSALVGAARCVDMFGELDMYNLSPTGKAADATALKNDFRAVEGDVLDAVVEYQGETEEEQLELF